MTRYVVEMLHQFEVDTDDVRVLVQTYGKPVFGEGSRVVEVLGSKITYFKVEEEGDK